MGRIIVEQIITADGFVQDADGGMRFMDAAPIDSTDSDQLALLEHVGAIVLGRKTYEMFVEYWPAVDPADEPVAEPINTLPKHVVSNTIDRAPWGPHAAAVVDFGDQAGDALIRQQGRDGVGEVCDMQQRQLRVGGTG